MRTSASDGFPGVLSYERQQGFMSYQQEYEVCVGCLEGGEGGEAKEGRMWLVDCAGWGG